MEIEKRMAEELQSNEEAEKRREEKINSTAQPEHGVSFVVYATHNTEKVYFSCSDRFFFRALNIYMSYEERKVFSNNKYDDFNENCV